jgi:antitoxin component YwqK of YwqJK toxin-antitoxin module
MKKITVLVLFSVLVLNLNAQEKKSYGSSGKLYAIENYSNGKLHGIQKYYYESGKLKEIENYSNGKIHGVRKGYYENGQIAHITNYKDGLNHGEFKI